MLLVLNAKLLLLVDDRQTQVLELNVALYQSMCPDHNVQGAIRETFNCATLLLRRLEP